jgi:hypothetical protein
MNDEAQTVYANPPYEMVKTVTITTTILAVTYPFLQRENFLRARQMAHGCRHDPMQHCGVCNSALASLLDEHIGLATSTKGNLALCASCACELQAKLRPETFAVMAKRANSILQNEFAVGIFEARTWPEAHEMAREHYRRSVSGQLYQDADQLEFAPVSLEYYTAYAPLAGE